MKTSFIVLFCCFLALSGQVCAQTCTGSLGDPNDPDGYAPGCDGMNDLGNIEALDGYPKAAIDIFNRFGERVFSSTAKAKRWDGRYKNRDVQLGVYHYILKLHKPDKTIPGSIMVLR